MDLNARLYTADGDARIFSRLLKIE